MGPVSEEVGTTPGKIQTGAVWTQSKMGLANLLLWWPPESWIYSPVHVQGSQTKLSSGVRRPKCRGVSQFGREIQDGPRRNDNEMSFSISNSEVC